MPPQRILIVDDEEDILTAMAAFLANSFPKADIVTAVNGLEAFELMQKQPVDLVLTDYRMPVLDGLALLERISLKWPDIPTVLVTAFPDMHLAIGALNKGHVRQFLTKPLDPPALNEVVANLLEKRLAAQQRDAALERASGVKRDPKKRDR